MELSEIVRAALRFRRRYLDTPVGPMLALSNGASLIALEFSKAERHVRLEKRLADWHPGHTIEDGDDLVLAATERWLHAYFAGDTTGDVAPAPQTYMLGTPFELAVWHQLLRIPAGETRSYGHIAREIGLPGAARAVGLANGANPLAIVVPCHRVIGSNGTLTGYGGGIDRKRWLLEHERRWSSAPVLF